LNTKLSDWVTHRPPLIALEAVKMAKKHMYFNSSKAIRELGLPQTPIEKAFEDAVAWFSTRGFFGKDFVTNRGALEWQSH
jgi:dihydroflavonol-4-reductase